MTRYASAPEVLEIATQLIADHRPELEDVRIDYVFRDKAAKSRGRTVLGKARKIGGLNAYLATGVTRRAGDELVFLEPTFFVVEIAHDMWINMAPWQRTALVDHELEHLVVDEQLEGPQLELMDGGG